MAYGQESSDRQYQYSGIPVFQYTCIYPKSSSHYKFFFTLPLLIPLSYSTVHSWPTAAEFSMN